MGALIIEMILGLAFSSPRVMQSVEQEINGGLLLTADTAMVKKTRALIRVPYKPYQEFEKSFDAQRFVIRRWGVQRVIVIDRRLPMFQELEQKYSLLLELANNIDKDLIIKLSGAYEGKGSALASSVDKLFPALSRPDGFDMSKSALGVDATINVTAHFSAGGGFKNVKIPLDPAASDRRNQALGRYSMPPKGRELTNEEKQVQAKQIEESSTALEQAPYFAFGTARREIYFGLRESAEIVRELMASIDLKTKQACESLLEKLGIFGLGQYPKGKVPFDQLPSEIGKQFGDALEGSWKSLGYDSQDEAAAAMAGASSFEISVNIGLYRSFRAFDPVTRKPGSGMVYNFILIRP